MPGILPMKVIKVGPSAQSRIAQACDRCRSKKIRCDGITPCCSQCANVGFECKTSDKLSRRAFPRGYTESLEERVRALELEVKELKDLLDEKDEKIDILSKIQSSTRRPSLPASPLSLTDAPSPSIPKSYDHFKVHQSPVLVNANGADACFMGPSSGRSFVDALKSKIQESGHSCPGFSVDSCFPSRIRAAPAIEDSEATPGRLVWDQLINTFFQEWAPLFPVLHRPTFLEFYAQFTSDPESMKTHVYTTQLNLVFSIASISTEGNQDNLPYFERQWRSALEEHTSEHELATLQCLILAEIYCICKADYKSLLKYNGIAVTLALRLGLHQSQKRYSAGALTQETRKKVFWSLYTIDCFAASILGLPKLMKDEDIHTEFPADIDDENVTERGFQPTLPGESTRLSNSLALFRLAQVMSRVLKDLYPAAPSYSVSMGTVSLLNDELDSWHDALPSHLRLEFAQDKPSTNMTSSRSPLISLVYNYTRTLIHRQVTTSNLDAKASSSTVTMAESSKRIVQIVQLLEERGMSFAMCINKNELLALSAFGLIYQSVDLNEGSKILQDNQRTVASVLEILNSRSYPGFSTMRKISNAVFPRTQPIKSASPEEDRKVSRRDSTASMPAPQSASKLAKKQLQAIASRFSFGSNRASSISSSHESPKQHRRSPSQALAIGNLALYARNNGGSQASLASVHSAPLPRRTYSESIHHHASQAELTPRSLSIQTPRPNLDYLSFEAEEHPTSPGFDPSHSIYPNVHQQQHDQHHSQHGQNPMQASEWERLVNFMNQSSQSQLATPLTPSHYDLRIQSSYPGPPNAGSSPDLLSATTSSYVDTSPSVAANDWASDACSWSVSGTSAVGSNAPHDHFGSQPSGVMGVPTQSVFSVSEESLTSGDDLSGCDLGAVHVADYLGVGVYLPSLDGESFDGHDRMERVYST
ncbi:hypothetical protein MMC25_000295 [Agyrium rufum]|nr:hypothetical protein [Agyrium rufum]